MTGLARRSLLRTLAAAAILGPTGSACASHSRSGLATARGSTPAASASSTPSFGIASSASSTGSAAPFQISSGPVGSPRVALTFHGQGDADLATALLREAESAGARITVLAVGAWLDDQPRTARRILDGGHELGNHTMHHLDISALPADRALAEITDCADRLTRLTGSPGRWFRPSQAKDCTPMVAAQARLAGYGHCLGYGLDSLDSTDPGPEAVTRTVLDAVRPGSVVSLHLGHPGTVTALPAILDGLRARSLQPVTMSELLT
ncbi:polysaccharide deacetylase family protein [Kitasatospora azatica]|uniref:polysaccharide deacetylase family protein n=1 Tax=Kitasatospora azatica TaxID=58347 RepID=UPI00055A0A4A|nr:polysaccharide deacetylase family protein [Kitasatospora azatica]